ncbi:Amyloid beta precursor like protein 1 [Saguinus oedipus]|uniref:Amyloid beta like protein 1 n=1 Tax=Saguinus oedipus TaxID=9490 RepID=A0ABQ9TTZ7_SAGOE|nr:Amyloid beta precursor like protein 1 [Saguinus oedipus]
MGAGAWLRLPPGVPELLHSPRSRHAIVLARKAGPARGGAGGAGAAWGRRVEELLSPLGPGRAGGRDMGPASPAVRCLGRRRGQPPLPLLLPLLLLLLRAQPAVGSLAGRAGSWGMGEGAGLGLWTPARTVCLRGNKAERIPEDPGSHSNGRAGAPPPYGSCFPGNGASMEAGVAGLCGRPTLHRDLRTGRWEPDPQRSRRCLRDPQRVLEYCRQGQGYRKAGPKRGGAAHRKLDLQKAWSKWADCSHLIPQMYPELQIARVEQATQAIPMEHWCGGARSGHCAHPHHQVVPFRCLPGEFVSEALLVPEGCRFLHQERMDECEKPGIQAPSLINPLDPGTWLPIYTPHTPQSWHLGPLFPQACSSQGLILHGSGMLLPCGSDRFRGVEYVCCPHPGTPDPSGTAVGDPSTRSWPPGGKAEGAEDEEEEESFPQPVDDYFVEPPQAEEEEEEERVPPPSSHTLAVVSKVTPTPRPTDGVDIYFGMPGEISEHEGFLRAKMDLEERRMRQINEVMREWAMADNQSKNLPKADRQALNEHFQSILQTLEEQVSGERQRLVETHATRVIALINDQRRAALEGFLAALQGDPPQPVSLPQAERVLMALRRYLRAEQKEQRHTLRHYQHVAAVDPEKAQQMRFQNKEEYACKSEHTATHDC